MDVIKIAFSFDHNFYRQAGVAISSLLHFSGDDICYDIYCVCADDVKKSDKKDIIKIVKSKSKNAKIYFRTVGNVFKNSYEIRGITNAAYFRLLLHKILPEIDKIIYSDVDVLFNGSLIDVWKMDLGDNLLGVVKDPLVNIKKNFEEYKNKYDYFKKDLGEIRGNYFNSGFLLINLKELREIRFDDKWIEMTKKSYYFVDQDILNITCKDNVLFLPPKFNTLMNLIDSSNYTELKNEKILSAEDVYMVYSKPIVLHYAGGKPWNAVDLPHFEKWWEYVRNNTQFFDYFNNRLIKGEKKEVNYIEFKKIFFQGNQYFQKKFKFIGSRIKNYFMKWFANDLIRNKVYFILCSPEKFLKKYFFRKKEKMVMTLLVRDEVDIIKYNIDFHLSHGVDFIVATDNGSVDGTREILKEYEEKGILHLIDEKTQDYSQEVWVNKMGVTAFEKYGADIIFHCDADEFWYPKSGNLKSEMKKNSFIAMKVNLLNVLLEDEGGAEKFPENMNYVVSNPVESNNLQEDSKRKNFYMFKYPPKVIFRTRKGVLKVTQGNHFIQGLLDNETPFLKDVTIYHFPLRSRSHFFCKVKNGGSSYVLNKKLSKNAGWHWRRWYESYKNGELDYEYKKLLLKKSDLKKLEKTGVIERMKKLSF